MAEWGAEAAAWGEGNINDDATTFVPDSVEVIMNTPFVDDGAKETTEKKIFRIRKNEIEEYV